MLPEAERPIVARALSKNPHERWLNCRAFVDAIRAVLTSPRTIDQSVNDFAEIEPNLTSYLIEQDDKSEEHVDSISTKFSDDFSIVTVAPFESPLSTLPENEVEPPQWSIEDPWDMAGHRRPVQRESQDRHSQPMNQLLSDLPARKNSLAWRFKLGLVVVLAMIGEAGLAVSRLSKKLSTRIIATGTLLIICGGLLTINRLGSPSGNPARLAAEKPIAKPEPDPRMRLTTEAIVKRMGPKVARIKGQWGVGSGFLIRPGILVTNAHVVDDELASDLEVFFPSAATDQGPFKGQLIYEDEKRDLAFLKLTATTESLSMARDFTFRSGMDVTVIGSFGLGSGDKILVDPFSRGILIAKTTVDGQPFFQLSASIHGGNSGGPVFDDYGDVIGVATATFRGKEGPGLCIPIEDLAEAVERVASQTQAEADNASNRHHLQTVSRLLSLYTLRFVEGLQIYDALMVNAVKEKESPSNGINKAASIVDPRLVKFIRLYEERLKNEITAISSNSSTPPLVSKHLVELFSTYSEMKRTIDSPPSDSNAFHQKVRELIDDRRIHVEALQIFLNFTDEPDLFQDVFKDFFDKPK
jgi:S1-C subfamily serine protease